MRGGHIYKHIYCTDMCLYVLKTQYIGPTYCKYRVAYVDNNGRTYAGGTETITVNKADLEKWIYVRKG